MKIAGLVAATAAAVGLLASSAASAATIQVSSNVDNKTNDQLCSLREAVDAANTNAVVNPAGGNDCPAGSAVSQDVIQLTPQTFNLAGNEGDNANVEGDLDLNSGGGPVRLQGAGPTNAASIIDANNFDRVLHVFGSAPVEIDKVTIRDGEVAASIEGGGVLSQLNALLTITGSRIQDSEVIGSAANMAGGGLAVTNGSSVIDDSSFFNNDVTHGAGGTGYAIKGGAIAFTAGAGSATITDSVIEANQVSTTSAAPFPEGGGISHTTSTFPLTILRTTIQDNDATGGAGRVGGGLSWTHGGQATPQLRIDNSTFAGNDVGSTGVSYGGGIAAFGGNSVVAFTSFTDNNAAALEGESIRFAEGGPPVGTFDLRNSVMDESGTNECASPGNPINSLGGNVERGTAPGTCDLDGPNDLISAGEKLASVADNGGPYTGFPTILPLAGSPVIDRIPLAACLDSAGVPSPADQRGFGRVGNCDSGAVEFGSTGPPVPSQPGTTTPPPGGQVVSPVTPSPAKKCKKGKKRKVVKGKVKCVKKPKKK